MLPLQLATSCQPCICSCYMHADSSALSSVWEKKSEVNSSQQCVCEREIEQMHACMQIPVVSNVCVCERERECMHACRIMCVTEKQRTRVHAERGNERACRIMSPLQEAISRVAICSGDMCLSPFEMVTGPLSTRRQTTSFAFFSNNFYFYDFPLKYYYLEKKFRIHG